MASAFFTKKRMLGRVNVLESNRSAHITDWQKITDVIRPARGVYLTGDRQEVSKRPTSMINSTPAVASRVLQAGMISGAASPAYPWFKFVTEDEGLMKWGPARIALEQRERILMLRLAKSNFYQNLQTGFGDSADFGTMAGIIDPHWKDIFSTKVFSPGEYLIDVDEHGDITTLIRKAPRTVFAIMSNETWRERILKGARPGSPESKINEEYTKGNYQTSFVVIEMIEPNMDYASDGIDSIGGKPWAKFVFLEQNTLDGEDNYLEVGGYNEYPGFDLRWDLASGNTWGWGPGILALGDAAALQTLEFRDAQAVEKAVKPPMAAPVFLKNKPISHVPGGVTYYDPYTANATKVEPLYVMQAGVMQAIDNKIQRTEFRINQVYFKDLFMMLATTDRREITAREVEEKHGEKLFQLGPVLQRTHRDALDRAIIRIYTMLDRAGIFPPAPRELKGANVKLEYISALAYAQRAAGASSLERFFGFTGNLSAAYPKIRHKIDINKGVDYYADAVGVPAEIMRSDAEADKFAAAEQQQAMAPEQAKASKDAAAAAELMSRTDTSRPSALSFLMNRGGIAA